MIEIDGAELRPYPDGTWWVNEHHISERFPLVCRGNTGEVYPNVVSPITGSLVSRAFARGQCRLAVEAGMATKGQLVGFDGTDSSMAPMFAGYLFSNVSMARSAVARMPGMTTDMVDRQMFGLSGAPPHRRGPGDRSVSAAWRGIRFMLGLIVRPDAERLARTRRDVDERLAMLPSLGDASDDELLAIVRGVDTFGEPMIYELLRASTGAGVGRSMLERIVAKQGGDELVNRLTAGLGTIESAEPAMDLWELGRSARSSSAVTQMFDDGADGLFTRLHQSGDVAAHAFVEQFDRFLQRHGSRGPQEWELEQPTWGTDPSIALAAIDRLRHAPAERDPRETAGRLAIERAALASSTRAALPRSKRKGFDLALRAASLYSAHREGTKAAFVRLLDPPRLALVELSRRSGVAHADLCLLTIDELPAALTDPASLTEIIGERRRRGDLLQARIPPFWFEGEIPPPHTWELRADRLRPDTTPRELTGLGVCPGVATGIARVVIDPADPRDLGPSDILVAPITDPSWTPLFLAAAGVVVDVGAQQSHAAIVSRELGIPAVVSVTGASTTIPDGTTITVDGSNGRVTIH